MRQASPADHALDEPKNGSIEGLHISSATYLADD